MTDFKSRVRKTLIWGAATLFIFYFFYDLLSLEFYNAMGTLIAVVGCIAITVCIVAFFICLFSLFDKPEDEQKKNEGSALGYVIFAIIMISLFGNGFLLVGHGVRLEQKELEQNGVIVMAKIIDGSSYAGRKFDFSHIKVMFIDPSGNERKIEIDVSKHSFKNFYLNEEIPIVYSTKNVGVNRVVYGQEDFSKYPMQK